MEAMVDSKVEVAAVEIPGGQQKFKLVVVVPVEGQVEGQLVEFGPFDTVERVSGEQKKFEERGYATAVATIFTCSSVRLALSAFPKIETEIVEPEVETEESGEVDNSDAVAAILDAFEANPELREGEAGRIVDVDEAYEAATAEHESREAEAAAKAEPEPEAAKPAPRKRSSRSRRQTENA